MVAIIGRKNSGKTTLVVRLAAELHHRGHRVMTIKHGAHTFNIDPESTDTYRHYHEGHAERVAMVAPDKFALVMRWSDEVSAEEIASTYMSDADIVLCEGFKRSALPKIEIHRIDVHDSPLYGADDPLHGEPQVDVSTYCAIVTDDDRLVTSLPTIRLDAEGWIEKLADFVEATIIDRRAS
jgi:molybdopterin-guanine dinucleotide biosynthesis protein B